MHFFPENLIIKGADSEGKERRHGTAGAEQVYLCAEREKPAGRPARIPERGADLSAPADCGAADLQLYRLQPCGAGEGVPDDPEPAGGSGAVFDSAPERPARGGLRGASEGDPDGPDGHPVFLRGDDRGHAGTGPGSRAPAGPDCPDAGGDAQVLHPRGHGRRLAGKPGPQHPVHPYRMGGEADGGGSDDPGPAGERDPGQGNDLVRARGAVHPGPGSDGGGLPEPAGGDEPAGYGPDGGRRSPEAGAGIPAGAAGGDPGDPEGIQAHGYPDRADPHAPDPGVCQGHDYLGGEGGGLLHRLIKLPEGPERMLPGAGKRLRRAVFFLQPADQALPAGGVLRPAQHLIRDDQIIHKRPGGLVPEEITDHPRIVPPLREGGGAADRFLPVFLGKHIREIPEDRKLRRREFRQAGDIGHPPEQRRIAPVAQGVAAHLLQLSDDHVLPSGIPVRAEGALQVPPLIGKEDGFPRALAPGERALAVQLRSLLPGGNRLQQRFHAVDPGVASGRDTVAAQAEEGISLGIRQIPAVVRPGAAEKAGSLRQLPPPVSAPGCPGGKCPRVLPGGFALQRADQLLPVMNPARPVLSGILAEGVNPGSGGRRERLAGFIIVPGPLQPDAHGRGGRHADEFRRPDFLPRDPGAVNHDLLGSDPMARKENMPVHPVQIDRDRRRPEGHQAEADDYLRGLPLSVKTDLEGLRVILQHLEAQVQPSLLALPQAGQPDPALLRGQPQDLIGHLRSRKQILPDLNLSHGSILLGTIGTVL